MLIAARALLGIAGATLSPSTLSLITTLFRDPRQQASAVGIWAGCFVVAAIVGGVLLEHFWWGSVLLLGVPAMVLLLVGPVLLSEYRNPQAGRLDLVSVALSLGAILPIVYGLKELARSGWQPLPIAAIVIGLAVGWRFLRRQHTLADGGIDPLLDLRLFTNPTFSTTLDSLLANSTWRAGPWP
jgi:MFS transporter, DHA2 family, multidrug resistance protein